MSTSRQKGTSFETLMVNYWQQWWPNIERRVLSGANDKGDISGMPLPMELKNCKVVDLAGWRKEANNEAENANAIYCPVVHKRRGVGDPARQWFTVETWFATELMLAWEHQ